MRFFTLPLIFLVGCARTETSSNLAVSLSNSERAEHEASGPRYAIAAQGVSTAASGEEILAAGGNIIDAAVAISFAISVERPQSTGIGGGGFLLYREGKTGLTFAVDFRERAPLTATRDMYLDKSGAVIPESSLNGIRSVAVPGLVAGLVEIHNRWGKLPLAQVMAPAIRAARDGVVVTPHLASALESRREVLARDPSARAIFLKPNGSPYRAGERIVQKNLAHTLELIARKGRGGFYSGSVAQEMLRISRQQGGLLTKRDLDGYKVKWRAPLRGTFRGLEVLTMPPPSSGGIHVLQILNMLEKDPLEKFGVLSPEAIHLTASVEQIAYADRAVFPGDPDFVKVPTDWLISKTYAEQRRGEIRSDKARPSQEVAAGEVPEAESPETTHFSLMDSSGNAVSSTQTINFLFGSGVVAGNTGVLLNDEMDDFSVKAGEANAYGALGGEANAIAPGKTPLSSMSPTIVMKDGTPVMAVGAPGGTRIITCVAATILNYFAYGLPAYQSVATARFHHQWMPDRLDIEEPGLKPGTAEALARMGWSVNVGKRVIPCRVELVVREGDSFTGVSDPRDSGRSLAK